MIFALPSCYPVLVAPKIERSTPTGRFVICPASGHIHPRLGRPIHPLLFAPVSQGKSGKFFFDCLECRKKGFLHDYWEFGMGFSPEAAAKMGAFLPMTPGTALAQVSTKAKK